ncbi:MAG: PTS fructose transporter subunit IIA [Candidatus Igneacidithiobacillus chanchocoensis]
MSQARILLLTHRGLGAAFLEVCTHIYGALPDDLEALAPEGDDLASLRQGLVERITNANAQSPLLILCDIRGASPANALPAHIDNPWVAVVYGLNLPMLLRALGRRGNWQELCAEILEGAHAGIHTAS